MLGLQLLLSQTKYSKINRIVDRAYNGIEAVKIVVDAVKSHRRSHGLILMDLSMPFMDGFEACKKIREVYRQQQLEQPLMIACTGHTEEDFIERAWTCEFDEVIQKPISLDILKLVLQEIID